TFVVTTDVRNELRRLESSNRTICHQIASTLRRSRSLDSAQLAISNEAFPGRQITAYYRGQSQNLLGDAAHTLPTPPPPKLPEAVIIVDEGGLYLRAVNRASLSTDAADELILVSSVPLDPAH